MGKLGLSVASSAAGHAVRSRLSKGSEEDVSAFHTKQAKKILETLGQMKGAAMKAEKIFSQETIQRVSF